MSSAKTPCPACAARAQVTSSGARRGHVAALERHRDRSHSFTAPSSAAVTTNMFCSSNWVEDIFVTNFAADTYRSCALNDTNTDASSSSSSSSRASAVQARCASNRVTSRPCPPPITALDNADETLTNKWLLSLDCSVCVSRSSSQIRPWPRRTRSLPHTCPPPRASPPPAAARTGAQSLPRARRPRGSWPSPRPRHPAAAVADKRRRYAPATAAAAIVWSARDAAELRGSTSSRRFSTRRLPPLRSSSSSSGH
jgi:hypothetical protein